MISYDLGLRPPCINTNLPVTRPGSSKLLGEEASSFGVAGLVLAHAAVRASLVLGVSVGRIRTASSIVSALALTMLGRILLSRLQPPRRVWAALISMLVFIWGSVSHWFLRHSERAAGWEMMLLFGVSAILLACIHRKMPDPGGLRHAAPLVLAGMFYVCSGWLEAWPLNRHLARAATAQARAEVFAETARLVRAANELGVSADRRTLDKLGLRLLDLSANSHEGTAEAWDCLQQLSNYRSSLERPALLGLPATERTLSPQQLRRLGTIQVKISAQSESVVWQQISKPRGPGMLVLDGVTLRHAVFYGVPLAYFGGPVSLKNVRFARCTFSFRKNPAALRFLRQWWQGAQSIENP